MDTPQHTSRNSTATDTMTTRPEPGEVRFEAGMPIEEAVSYFEAIVAGLKKGTINLRQSDKTLTLNPPSHLELNVRAVRKKDKEKLSFELAWRSSTGSELAITTE